MNYHCIYRSEGVFHSTTVIADSENDLRRSLAFLFPDTADDVFNWEIRELQSGPPPFR